MNPYSNPQPATSQAVEIKANAPNPKVPSAALGGPALAGLIVWLFSLGGVEVPTGVALEIAGLLAFAVGYMVPGRAN